MHTLNLFGSKTSAYIIQTWPIIIVYTKTPREVGSDRDNNSYSVMEHVACNAVRAYGKITFQSSRPTHCELMSVVYSKAKHTTNVQTKTRGFGIESGVAVARIALFSHCRYCLAGP